MSNKMQNEIAYLFSNFNGYNEIISSHIGNECTRNYLFMLGLKLNNVGS